MLHNTGADLKKPFALDFEISWNERVSLSDSRITEAMVLSQDMTDEILCKNAEWTNAKYIPPKLRYFDYDVFLMDDGTILPPQFVGMALSGLPYVQSLSGLDAAGYGVDPFYPDLNTISATTDNSLKLDIQEQFDTCGTFVSQYAGHTFLSYKNLPSCLYTANNTVQKIIDLCQESPECKIDPLKFLRYDGGFSQTYQGLQIVGVAVDGHVIYGPYNENHELWTCEDHDICNGRFFEDMDNSYAYVITSTHPYVPACWGPAPRQIYKQKCS